MIRYRDLILPLILLLGIRIHFYSGTIFETVGDQIAYTSLAKNLIQNGIYGETGTPQFKFPPVYPMLLAGWSELTGSSPDNPLTFFILNLLLDVGSLFLLFRLGSDILGFKNSRRYGLLLIAVHPSWFSQTQFAVSEPTSLFLFLVFLFFWTRPRISKNVILSGLALGALILTRSAFLWLPPFLALAEWWVVPRLYRWSRNRSLPKKYSPQAETWAIFIAALLFLPALWATRNLIQFGVTGLAQKDNAIKVAYLFAKYPERQFVENEDWEVFKADPLLNRLGEVEHTDPAAYEHVLDDMRVAISDAIQNDPIRYAEEMVNNFFRTWVTYQGSPFSYMRVWGPIQIIFRWGFVAPLLLLGCAGLMKQALQLFSKKGVAVGSLWRENEVRLWSTQISVISLVTLITLSVLTQSRYALIPLVVLSLWVDYSGESLDAPVA